MHPGPLFSVFGYSIGFYTIAHGLGFLAALPVALWLCRERGLPTIMVLDFWLLCASADLIGTPVVVAALRAIGVHLPATFSLAQVAVVAVAVSVYLALNPGHRQRYPQSHDLIAVPALTYLTVARLGCFAAGCCHGKPAYDLPWAVTFDNPASACIYRGIPVHPTQLYEASGAALIAVALVLARKRPGLRGALAWLAMASYAVLRFVVEIFRGDQRLHVGPLSFAQLVCVVMLVGSLAAIAARRRVARRQP